MKLIQSSKIPLPIVYLIENEKEMGEIPVGIPFIRGNSKDLDRYVRLLEKEVLLKSALATGLPFKWENILREIGYREEDFHRVRAESTFTTRTTCGEFIERTVEEYVVDISYQVDLEYLKTLKILPSWFSNIEEAIKANILNSIIYNPNLYNKKLDLVSGGVDLNSPEKNLIIIDISGSIPKSISEAILLLSKTMSSQFFADLLITGSKSTLYDYSDVDGLDVKKVYLENGEDNDQVEFRKLLEGSYKKYNTAIIFGDNHSPSMAWNNKWNKHTEDIPKADGKKLNKWQVRNIFSFHTTSNKTLAGYGDWFSTEKENIVFMDNWVKYLN